MMSLKEVNLITLDLMHGDSQIWISSFNTLIMDLPFLVIQLEENNISSNSEF
jgi:hypothetical protein